MVVGQYPLSYSDIMSVVVTSDDARRLYSLSKIVPFSALGMLGNAYHFLSHISISHFQFIALEYTTTSVLFSCMVVEDLLIMMSHSG